MSEGNLYALAMLTLVTVVLVVFIWQVSANIKARASAAREEAYRKLAEQISETLQKIAQDQQALSDGLVEVRSRTLTIETMLRDVQ